MSITVTKECRPKPTAGRSTEWRASTARRRSSSPEWRSCCYRSKSYSSWSKPTSSPHAPSNAWSTDAEWHPCSPDSSQWRSSSTDARPNASAESGSRCWSRHSRSSNITTSTSNLTTTTRSNPRPISSNAQFSSSNERHASTRLPTAKRHDAAFQPQRQRCLLIFTWRSRPFTRPSWLATNGPKSASTSQRRVSRPNPRAPDQSQIPTSYPGASHAHDFRPACKIRSSATTETRYCAKCNECCSGWSGDEWDGSSWTRDTAALCADAATTAGKSTEAAAGGTTGCCGGQFGEWNGQCGAGSCS